MCVLQAIIIGEWDDDIATCKNPALSAIPNGWLWQKEFFVLLFILHVHVLHEDDEQQLSSYAQSWLRIKCHPLCTDGPLNLDIMIILLKDPNATEKCTAKAAIQRNAFQAHPGNLLLAMFADEDPDILQDAVTLCQKLIKHLDN